MTPATSSLALRFIRPEQLAVLESHGLMVVSREEWEQAVGAVRVQRRCVRCRRTFLGWSFENFAACPDCRGDVDGQMDLFGGGQ